MNQPANIDVMPLRTYAEARRQSLTTLGRGDSCRDPLTDPALAKLNGLARLKSREITGTQATDVGLAELRRALPGAYVWKK